MEIMFLVFPAFVYKCMTVFFREIKTQHFTKRFIKNSLLQ